jgi:hypothetical protein
MRIVLILGLVLLGIACQSQNKKGSQEDSQPDNGLSFLEEQEQLIVGDWESIALEVRVRTYENSDTSFLVEVDEHTWQMKMNVDPIITSIFAEGTYRSVQNDVYGNTILNTQGIWMLDSDSLVMEDDKGRYQYSMFIDQGIMELKTYIDYDGDGRKDDFYIGKYRRLGSSKE